MGTRGLWVIHEARLHMMIFSQRKKSVNFSEIKKKHKTKYFYNYSRPLKRADFSGVVTLLIDSRQVPVFCHVGDFGCGEGGWTPVMKIDGSKVF